MDRFPFNRFEAFRISRLFGMGDLLNGYRFASDLCGRPDQVVFCFPFSAAAVTGNLSMESILLHKRIEIHQNPRLAGWAAGFSGSRRGAGEKIHPPLATEGFREKPRF